MPETKKRKRAPWKPTQPNTTDLVLLATLAEMDAQGDLPELEPARGEGKAFERLRRNGLVYRSACGSVYRITQTGLQLATAMCVLLNREAAVAMSDALRRMTAVYPVTSADRSTLRAAADVIVPDSDPSDT